MHIVEFVNFKKQYKSVKKEINQAIAAVLNRQRFILGEELEGFEKEFSDYLGCKYAIGVGSGTDALLLSLLALGVGKNDEVIMPTNTFIASAHAPVMLGAKPVFVDCDPLTYQIDIEQLEKNITKKTKVIIPVHLYGSPCDIKKIISIAKKYKISVIEDACQAHGAEIDNRKVGTFADLGVFSFYPAKNLGCLGDGGCVVTNNHDLYIKIKKLRNYGETEKYFYSIVGINSRLDEIQAAVLRVKLKHIDIWNNQRREIADLYKRLLLFKSQKHLKNSKPVYHIFPITVTSRDKCRKYLLSKKIQTGIHYPVPLHMQESLRDLGYNKGDFPVSETVASELISLPLYPGITKEEVTYVSKHLNSFF